MINLLVTPVTFPPQARWTWVATNRQDLITQVEVSDPFSDHCPVVTELELPGKTHAQRTLLVTNYKQADWEGFRQNLFHSPLLEAIQGTSDVDAAWKVWSDLFWSAVHRAVPYQQITLRPCNKPWMTSYLYKLSRTKHRLFRAAKRDQQHFSWERYKEARNKCNKEFSKAEKKYFSAQQALLSDLSPSSHQWWAKVKQIARISGPQSGVPDLEYNGISATTEIEKANLLASFFAEQCTCANQR